MADAPFSVLRGPPGSFAAERLAAAVEMWDRWQHCVWLRAPTSHPGRLAGSLADACAYHWSADGGPDRPRPPERAGLLEALHGSPADAVIVVELPGRVRRGLRRVLAPVRTAAADRGVSLVAVTESRFPPTCTTAPDWVLSSAELWDPAVLDERTVLPERSRHRLLDLAGDRPAVLADVLDAADMWPADVVAAALDTSRWLRVALDRLSARLLELCSAPQREALQVCVEVGYWHPQLGTEPVRAAALRPWVLPLEHEWGSLRPVWARSLRRALTGRARHPRVGVPTPAAGGGEPRTDRRQSGLLEARLLGDFEVRVDRAPVTWSGQRGVSILRYLLARRRHTCPRDQLIEEFWPDTPAPAARNRLQVAISGLRHDLRTVTALPVIEYVNGAYRIDPRLRVTVDVARFEAEVGAGRAAERAGDPAAALTSYRNAVDLYRGDFASDAPFEQWTLLPRESLLLAFIDTLDRMSAIQLDLGHLDDCICTGHRMLDVDPCREDAHRLLMHCYARQGRPYLALRQYELCCRVLRATLSTRPAPETTRVYAWIRNGAPRRPTR
jgi:DNA-binding SARP family transcriptional activator